MRTIAEPSPENAFIAPDATELQEKLNEILRQLIDGDLRCLHMCIGSSFDYTVVDEDTIRIPEDGICCD
jgi:hypothetical protein